MWHILLLKAGKCEPDYRKICKQNSQLGNAWHITGHVLCYQEGLTVQDDSFPEHPCLTRFPGASLRWKEPIFPKIWNSKKMFLEQKSSN